jgi:hypothetical protein
VHAGFGAQVAEGVVALDLDGGALDAGHVALGLVFQRGLEALALAVRRYWRSSMLAQSQASVPPAPAWMSMKQFSGSAGLLNMRRNSSCSTIGAGWRLRPRSRPEHIAHHLRAVLGGSSRSMRSFSLPGQLDVFVLLDQLDDAHRNQSAGWGLKVMLMTPGAASTFTTP